ncbi:MAG: hypothetical protein A2Z99_11440 [Treponema sp. GWB1_62_6]|nr:MAG: hypothetical protein A2001_07735 [Treponema sp. GWC1_61_84]OHE67976.1 MAG: hypothetical protein A2413_14205 [Treponema sp. RIFOXYC1_FULL_61_9]OHE70113.1 MAG: hypothetical protein A2Z99_11440 [Treponema sp. GWB1_62_6]HCM25519.1 hypothetical protein [Treponema sp.]
MRKSQTVIYAALAAALLISSCQQFFTTSLAAQLARDPADLMPDVDTGNVDELLAQAAGNPEMSLALMDSIIDALDGATGAELVQLQSAAVTAATGASGLSEAILASGGDIVAIDFESATAQEEIITIMEEALGGLNQLADASAGLIDIIPDPVADSAGFDAFVLEADSEQLAMAAITLLASSADASAGGTSDYIDNLDPENPDPGAETMAVELARAAIEKSQTEGGSGFLTDMLANLNLSI